MLPADTAMKAFAEKYLVDSLAVHETVEPADPNILRWVMKTVSNHERSLNAGTVWWKSYVDFFRGQGGDLSRVDVLLAPWKDLSPGGVATVLMGVLTLGAKEMQFMGLRQCDVKAVNQFAECRWVLKVGSGVFALIVWKPGVHEALRESVVNELREYGWLLAGKDTQVGCIPFNYITCGQYNIPCHPDDYNPVEQFKRNAGEQGEQE
jgi:hypothetical protein